MRFPALFLIRLILHLSVADNSPSAVLGVDFGSDMIKISSVSRGKGISIMLDGQSKRTIPSLIFFSNDSRYYGNEAINYIFRKPLDAIYRPKDLIGFQGDIHDALNLTNEYISSLNLTSPKDDDPRQQTIYYSVHLKKNYVSISPEEALSMILRKIKAFHLSQNGLSVSEIVLTIPSYYTTYQRKAVINAVNLAGMKVLSLIGENSAAAIQFASKILNNKKSKEMKILFFNMGYSKTELNVFKIGSSDFKANKTKNYVEEIEYIYDQTVSGRDFDKIIFNRMVEILREKYNLPTETINRFQNDKTATTRLLYAIEKCKRKLSINKESSIVVDKLIDGIKFSYVISRKEFEILSKNLIDKSVRILNQIKNDYDLIVFVGGSTRIPFFQKAISVSSKKKISKIVNIDEAPALGAGIRAFNISAGFRLNKIHLSELNHHPIYVIVSGTENNIGLKPSSLSKSAKLFNRTDYVGKKRSISFKTNEDFDVRVYYSDEKNLPRYQKPLIFELKTDGVQKFYEENKEKGFPRLKLTFELDENEIIRCDKIQAFYSDKTKNNKTKDDLPENKTKIDQNSSLFNQTDKNLTKKSSNFTITKEIKIIYSQKKSKSKTSKNLLDEFDRRDNATAEAAKSLNEFQNIVYNYNEIVTKEAFNEVSTEKEKSSVLSLLNKSNDWLAENYGKKGLSAEIYSEEKEKLIKGSEGPMFRLYERMQIPESVDYAKSTLEKISKIINQTILIKKWVSIETIEAFKNETNEFIVWLNDNLKILNEMDKTITPTFLSKDIVNRTEILLNKAEEFNLMEDINENIKNITGANGTIPTNATKKRRKRRKLRKSKKNFFGDLYQKTKKMFKSLEPQTTPANITTPSNKTLTTNETTKVKTNITKNVTKDEL